MGPFVMIYFRFKYGWKKKILGEGDDDEENLVMVRKKGK